MIAPNAPLRVLAYLNDEETPTWWTTIDYGRTFERATGDRIVVDRDQLIQEANGLNDCELLKVFSANQKARYRRH